MTGLGNLIRRNCKLFFKDKAMFFTSLITPMILLVLYATFLAKVYRDAEELRARRANVEAWRNGFYTASALSSTVGNMFRKKGSSPIKYMDRPIPLTQKEQDEYKYQRALEAQERIKRAMFSMMNQKDGGSNS